MKYVLAFISLLGIQQVFAQHVSFVSKNSLDTGLSIYFDYEGMLYPEGMIESDFKACNYSVKVYLQWHKDFADSLFSAFGVQHETPISEESYKRLNAFMLIKSSHAIQDKFGSELPVFGIHGYRKSYLESATDVSSVNEYRILDSTLSAQKLNDYRLVKIYWDSRYDCCFSANRKKNNTLFALFQDAYSSADLVGNSLEIFFSEFNNQQFNVIAHSLGCKVAVRALVNCSTISRVNAVLIAPAMGRNFFLSEYHSTITKPNINWLIAYNEKDFVLKKKDNKMGWFGPGPYQYGETTFGLNRKNCLIDAEKACDLEFGEHVMDIVNMTSTIGKRHSWRVYLRNSEFNQLAQFATSYR